MSVTFEGAKTTSYNQNWYITGEMLADTELSSGDTLKILRERVRQLIKDNPVVNGVQQAFVNSICGVGPTIKSESENNVQKKQVNNLLYYMTREMDISGAENLNDLIEQIVAWSFVDGDILINLPIDKKRDGIQTVVELIEASRIKTPTNMNYDKEADALLRNGVEYDSEGRIKGYWVKKFNKVDNFSDNKENFDFFPMYRESEGIRRRVTFLFKAPLNSRPKAARQYPVLASCLALFKHLHDYQEAVLVGARVAACFSAFVNSNNPTQAMKSFTTDSTGTTTYNPDETMRTQRLQPGQIFYLKQNESINFASPNRPNDNVDSYILRIYKTISMSLRIPYPILFLDTVEVNYSSWRGAALEAMKMINRWRKKLDEVIDWVIETKIFEAMTLGLVRGDLSTVELTKRWPIAGILDPEKEARANKIALQNGTKSKQMICDEEGLSYEQIQLEREQEALNDLEIQAKVLKRQKELEEEYGILFNPAEEQDDRDTERRPGEVEGSDLDEDDAKERRKQDGNW